MEENKSLLRLERIQQHLQPEELEGLQCEETAFGLEGTWRYTQGAIGTVWALQAAEQKPYFSMASFFEVLRGFGYLLITIGKSF
jgi:hypothetical protein